MSLGSSPGVYLRCSLNSTEKPWKGLACRPCKNPLAMNCARRSSRLIWRMTSGFRYCSADGIGGWLVVGCQLSVVSWKDGCQLGYETVRFGRLRLITDNRQPTTDS